MVGRHHGQVLPAEIPFAADEMRLRENLETTSRDAETKRIEKLWPDEWQVNQEIRVLGAFLRTSFHRDWAESKIRLAPRDHMRPLMPGVPLQQAVLVEKLVDLREDGLVGDRVDIEIEEIPVASFEFDEPMFHLFTLEPRREGRRLFKRH